MDHQKIKLDVERYYTGKIRQFGETPQGVDWNSEDSQNTRFSQLLKVAEATDKFSLNDLGCGYGALFDFIQEHHMNCSYMGYDLSDTMVAAARSRHRNQEHCQFVVGDGLQSADFTVASGIFNVRLETPIAAWEDYVFATLAAMNAASARGFAFNALTAYSDADRMRSDLYYPDPGRYFGHCMTNFSRSVALLHDYRLYEFTILVKKVV